MFNDVQNLFAFTLTAEEVLVRFVVAFGCGLLISFFYRWSYRGSSYSASYIIALIALGMITASVIMVIGNNLARAFGLVGAMSIIRFRTAVKDTLDIIFIFFSLAMGMAAGVGLHVVALVGTAIIGLVILGLTRVNYGVPNAREYLLQFQYTSAEGSAAPPYQDALDSHTRKARVVSIKSIGEDEEILELAYYIKLRRADDGSQLMHALSSTPGVAFAHLFFDEVHV